MQVSIIIINFNTYQFTCNCIQSIIDRSHGFSYEIILVDNASKECDPEIFKTKFQSVILIKSDINLGFAGGNNLGLKYAQGEYILLLNSDTELLNNAIAITYTKMKSEDIRLAGCRTYNYDGTLQYTCEPFPSVKMSLYNLLGVNRIATIIDWKKIALKYNYDKDFYPDWIWGSFFLFKKNILSEFKDEKLPDNFFMYGEDMLWCFILRDKKVKIKYYVQPEIRHYFSGDKKIQDVINPSFENTVTFLKSNYSRASYSIIFTLDVLFSISRLKWRDAFKKYKYYIS
jgi:hypothetical protein